VRTVIDLVADKHDDWIHMARSFGCSEDDANELVQEMYIRIHRYVESPEKIMYNETEVNTYYIYVTLRNLFLSNFHIMRKNNHIQLEDDMAVADEPIHFDYEHSFSKLIHKIDSMVNDWYWYDKKLWEIHFNKEMSMRRISKETKISLSSIFNTLKNGKTKIRQGAIEEYKEYIRSKKR